MSNTKPVTKTMTPDQARAIALPFAAQVAKEAANLKDKTYRDFVQDLLNTVADENATAAKIRGDLIFAAAIVYGHVDGQLSTIVVAFGRP